MKATTVKVDGELLREIEEVKPKSQSVTAFVRAAVRKAVERHRHQAAAIAYREFLQQNPEEQEWVAEWQSVDLTTPPKGAGP